MALLLYMTALPGRNRELLDPAVPVSSSLQSTTIKEANMAIACVSQDEAEKSSSLPLDESDTSIYT